MNQSLQEYRREVMGLYHNNNTIFAKQRAKKDRLAAIKTQEKEQQKINSAMFFLREAERVGLLFLLGLQRKDGTFIV